MKRRSTSKRAVAVLIIVTLGALALTGCSSTASSAAAKAATKAAVASSTTAPGTAPNPAGLIRESDLPAGWLDAGPPRDDPTAAADERKIPECQAMLSTFPHTKRTKYASHEFDKGTISDVSAKAANEFATYVSEGVSKAKYAAFASADTKTCIEKYSDAAAAAQQKSVRLNATSPADRSVVYSVSATAASTPAFADGATGYDVTLTAVVEGVTKFQETVTFVAVRIGLSLLAFQFVSVGLADTSLANGVMAKCLQRITTGSEA